MYCNQAKRNGSLHKTNLNVLQRYLLNKSKHHQMYVMRHTYNPTVKHIELSSDYLLGHTQYRPEANDTPQMVLPLEKYSPHKTNDQEIQKDKKLKSNKTLLSILLNNFHHEQYRNEMFVDIDASFRHDKTSHTVSLHKSSKNDIRQEIKKQIKKGHMEGLPKFASLYFNHLQKSNNNKVISKKTKRNFNQTFPEVDANKQKKKSSKAIKDILKQSNINNSPQLNPHRSQNFLHRTRKNWQNRQRKQKQCQRSSQKCYKLCLRQNKNTNQNPLSKLDPWSTTMINQQIADL